MIVIYLLSFQNTNYPHVDSSFSVLHVNHLLSHQFCLLFIWFREFNSIIVTLLYVYTSHCMLFGCPFTLAFYLLMAFCSCFVEAMYPSSTLFIPNSFLIVSSGFDRKILFCKCPFPLSLVLCSIIYLTLAGFSFFLFFWNVSLLIL